MVHIERVLDRVPQWDDRNLDYPIRELIGSPPIQERIWNLPECLDQGREGACVGYGWVHELYAEPVRVEGVDPRAVYKRAQQLDEWPGEAYSGTSVLAGAKAIQELGHLIEYRWALNVQDVLATISAHGPVVIGVNWHQGMERTDRDGFVRATGRVLGGHCVVLRGVLSDPKHGWVILGRNSWGLNWGQGGDFKLTGSDLETLLREGGEVCVPVVRVITPPEPEPEIEPAVTDDDVEPVPAPDIHPSTLQLLELFEYKHLPEHLQVISQRFHGLAWKVAQQRTERGAEQTTCLRKLLEAKDCAVRMAVPLGQIGNNSPPLNNDTPKEETHMGDSGQPGYGSGPEQDERERQDAERAQEAEEHRQRTSSSEESNLQTDQPDQSIETEQERYGSELRDDTSTEQSVEGDGQNVPQEPVQPPDEEPASEEPPSPAGEEPRVDGAPDLTRTGTETSDGSGQGQE